MSDHAGVCNHVGTRCSDLVSCSQDDSSEESREGPIVDVGVGGPGRKRKGRQPTRRRRKGRKPTRMMYYTRKGSRGRAPEGSGGRAPEGYEGSGGRAPEGSGENGCPTGTLENCIGHCPNPEIRQACKKDFTTPYIPGVSGLFCQPYKVCAAICRRRCSNN